jgi:UDP-N-acetylglucosamine acyltransferase
MGMESGATIHPTAIVSPRADVGVDVIIGPYSVVGPNVRIGDGTDIGSHVLIDKDTTIGKKCRIFKGAILGTDPQDLKYKNEETYLIVGDETQIREYATLHRGAKDQCQTKVGSGCLIMAYAHVAHDCEIGDGVILANSVNMAGHVLIEDHVIIGGVTPIHQFVRIGKHAFIGGGSRVNKDVPPFVRAVGNPLSLSGLNSVGLLRHGFDEEVRLELKRAYRLFFRSELNISRAAEKARRELKPLDDVHYFIDFIETSDRGITL